MEMWCQQNLDLLRTPQLCSGRWDHQWMSGRNTWEQFLMTWTDKTHPQSSPNRQDKWKSSSYRLVLAFNVQTVELHEGELKPKWELFSFTPTCHLQSEEFSVPQLHGEFQNVISALRSKLNSRAAPLVLHLDIGELQEELPSNPRVPVPPTGAPLSSSSSSTNQESPKPWSLSTTLGNEPQSSRTQDELVTEGETVKWSSTSEDSLLLKHGDRMELEPFDLLPQQQASAVTENARTQPPAVAGKTGHTLNLHRKYRSLLRKRQTSGSGGKSRHHTHFSQMCNKIENCV